MLLASCGTVLGLVRTIPQLLVVKREKVLSGLSVAGCLGVLVSMTWWAIYAILIGDVLLTVSSVGASIPPLLTWRVLYRRGLVKSGYQMALISGISLGIFGGFIGVEIVGLLASCSTVLYAFPQFWRVLTTRDVKGVSAVTWVLTAMNTSVWALYGVREQLLPTILPALILLPTASLILGLKARDKRQALRQSAYVNAS
jgi:uncharacterized protein with PQ loop repeat